MKAFVSACASELSTFGAETPADSLPALFIEWADKTMTQKHLIFDAETCMRVEVGPDLALAVVETVFLGEPACGQAATYRGERLVSLFHSDRELVAAVTAAAAAEDTQDNPLSKKPRVGPTEVYQVDLGGWVDLKGYVQDAIRSAVARGEHVAESRFQGYLYRFDLEKWVQINTQTGKRRPLRRHLKEEDDDPDEEEDEDDGDEERDDIFGSTSAWEGE